MRLKKKKEENPRLFSREIKEKQLEHNAEKSSSSGSFARGQLYAFMETEPATDLLRNR